MKSTNETQPLGEMSALLAPKKGCKICKLVLIVAVILFISSVLLAAFTLGRSRTGAPELDAPRALTADQQNDRYRTLQDLVKNQQGSTTIIMGKATTK